MKTRLRRQMTATGTWAVTGHDGKPLPGRWETEGLAREHGLLGVYLLSGYGLAQVGVE